MAKRYTAKPVNGELLKQLIEQKPIKPTSLAKRAGVGISTIYKMMKGIACEMEKIEKVAAVLGVDCDRLTQSDTQNIVTTQAENMGINLMFNIPAEQSDPDGHLATFSRYMANAFDEYTNYIKDTKAVPDIPGFADWMRNYRRLNELTNPHDIIAGWNQIRVYYVTSFDRKAQQECYFFIVAAAHLHEQMMDTLERYHSVPAFGIVVARGYGATPSQEVKDFIKEFYDFDYDKYAKG